MLGWHDPRPLTDVLPDKEAKALNSAFGYTRCDELLQHYPRTYRRHADASILHSAAEGESVTVVGQVRDYVPVRRGSKTIDRYLVECDGAQFMAVYFNAPYIRRLLSAGTVAVFSGKVKYFRTEVQLQHPDVLVVESDQAQTHMQATGSLRVLAQYGSVMKLLRNRDFVPVYPATAKVSTWRIMAAIWEVLDSLPPITEPLDFQPRGLPTFDQALRLVHQPDHRGPTLPRARQKYNEALQLALTMALRRDDQSARRAPALIGKPDGYRAQLLESLPFPLTQGQRAVDQEIVADLEQEHPMSRLLQGEVGSGKTIVALLAMLQAVDAGRQCALLVPTEVLAVQHARSLTNTLGQAGVGATVVAVTGSMSKALKRDALLKAVSGEADIIVGTHALIQETVEFFDLGLVVVDEQHRFGVEQRDALRAKGTPGMTPHVIVMTATPIPRTIAITVFGDLAVSTLKELPGGRRPIQSAVVPEARPAWVERAYERIREEITKGHQAYVVCPRIEGDGGVLDMFDALTTRYADLNVGLLHGRLKGEEKDAVMSDFAAGGIDILVASTVIEVGVDVPNATVMLIRESENFGVSQLHQLRGRVGRGGHASLCLFHTVAEPGTDSFDRVDKVSGTSDGFALANLDLLQRQEGDVLGTSQSGAHRSLKLLNLVEDYALIEQAHNDAAALVERNRPLAQRLSVDLEDQAREYLDKS